MSEILVRPIVSEKASLLSNAGIYVFQVGNKANKFQIKRAVQEAHKVRVRRVNIVKALAKKRMFRGIKGLRPGYKKALVFLEKGQKIDLT